MTSATLTNWLTALDQAVADSKFVKLSLSKPTAAATDLKSIDVRPTLVKRALKLSFTYHYKTRDIVKNYSCAECTALLTRLLTEEFQAARLCTLAKDISLTRENASFTMQIKPPSNTNLPNFAHDRPKQHMWKAGAKAYLQALETLPITLVTYLKAPRINFVRLINTLRT